jgi:ATP-binding cassette subfamily B protein RaxB
MVDERLTGGVRAARRVPVVLQAEAVECGLACIAMVASYYGHSVNLAGLRAKFPVSMKGSTLADVMSIASALDLSSRPLRIELEELSRLRTPALLHWDLRHFVVLVAADSKSITVHDPSVGKRHFTMTEASRRFTGVALELTPVPDFTPRKARQDFRWQQLVGGIAGFKRAVLQVLSLALALEIFALVAPLFMQWTVDQVIVAGDRHLLGTLAIGFLLLGLVQVAIGWARGWTVIQVGTILNVQWLANAFAHLIRLPVSYFEKRHLGDVMSRFGSMELIQKTLAGTFIEAILDGLMAGVVLTMMFFYSVPLSLVVLAAVAAYAGMRAATYRLARTLAEEEIVCSAKQQSAFIESIRGIQAIKLFGAESDRQARWVNMMIETSNRSLRSQQLSLYLRSFKGLVFAVESVVVVFLGASAVLDSTLSLGMLFAFIAYKTTFATRVSTLIDRSIELFMLRLQADRLADILLAKREDAIVGFEQGPRDGDVAIEVRDLCFRYADTEPYVLDRVSFHVGPGEAVAITGPSGCGKTTLVKLLLGLLNPTSGDILVNGISIVSRSPVEHRRSVAAVMQDDQLFAGSIAENIAFFDPTLDAEAIERSARLAAIHEDIRQMPMGYHTLVGDMGAALSGGQKQRVLLARALYKRPRLLILDEATSHLNVENEWRVNEAVSGLQLTRIIVAHRAETLRMADRTIVLQRQGDATEA